jgi:hypothetical protein
MVHPPTTCNSRHIDGNDSLPVHHRVDVATAKLYVTGGWELFAPLRAIRKSQTYIPADRYIADLEFWLAIHSETSMGRKLLRSVNINFVK